MHLSVSFPQKVINENNDHCTATFVITTIADTSSMQWPCTESTYFITWSWCAFVLVRNAWFNITEFPFCSESI